MASVEKRVRSSRTAWVARWRDPSGRTLTRSFVKRSEADDYLDGIRHSLRSGAYVDPYAGRITVGEWSQRWLAAQGHLKTSTRARYEGIVNRQVAPRWERVPLTAVRHADVAGWVAELALAPATVRYVHRVFSLLLDLAVRDGRLASNPANGVRLPRVEPAEKRFLTHQQVRDLADAAGPHATAILTLAYCGLRWGELAALRVSRLDLMRRRLTVAEAVTEVRGHLTWGTPKSHQYRSVPVPRFLLDDLAALVAGRAPEDLVFVTSSGAVLRNLNFRR
ncbi:MAG: site-specific integrase, partial [Nocardioidaceae bacterium]|nr:site-specific integrase [Nocardioidaceae bacterium]